MDTVWGKKEIYHDMGYVADFCPICRDIKTFKVKRISGVRHVHQLAMGEGEFSGFKRTCQKCGTDCDADAHLYSAFSNTQRPMKELIRTTFPSIYQTREGLLTLETRIKSDPKSIPPIVREKLIQNSFVILSKKVEARFATNKIDIPVIIAMVAAVFIAALGYRAIRHLFPNFGGEIYLLMIGCAVAYIIWQVVTSADRYMKREVMPILATALRPLRPTKHELDKALRELASLESRIVREISSEDLLRKINLR